MDGTLRVQLLSKLSSQGVPADAVASFVNAIAALDPAAGSELAAMLVASPSLGRDLWQAARDKMKAAEGGMTADDAVAKEVLVFRQALAELE